MWHRMGWKMRKFEVFLAVRFGGGRGEYEIEWEIEERTLGLVSRNGTYARFTRLNEATFDKCGTEWAGRCANLKYFWR